MTPQAGAVVQQSISQIRTVAAYNGEEAAVNAYNGMLAGPQAVRVGVGGEGCCRRLRGRGRGVKRVGGAQLMAQGAEACCVVSWHLV